MLLIYKATTFTELISTIQNSRRKGTTKFSYRQLADILGYRSPRTLAMVHKGQRLPNHNLVRKIINNFELSPHEIEFTFLLAEKAFAEKKNLSTFEIDEKLSIIRKKIESDVETINLAHSFEENLYLTEDDLHSARTLLTAFLKDLVTKYPPSSSSDTQRYLVKLRIYRCQPTFTDALRP